ncbi:MAG: DUF3098 domain-containing protein [Cyclobacteriaceae bacterium]|jgi:hypothetical protein|nr:DUF3098 domain-containing protein [Flammeovirgaceae bacterium]
MSKLPFGKKNYQLMIAGIVTLIIGFTIMAMDNEKHGFGFLGLTLGPLIVLTGFVLEIFAILHTPKESK